MSGWELLTFIGQFGEQSQCQKVHVSADESTGKRTPQELGRVFLFSVHYKAIMCGTYRVALSLEAHVTQQTQVSIMTLNCSTRPYTLNRLGARQLMTGWKDKAVYWKDSSKR